MTAKIAKQTVESVEEEVQLSPVEVQQQHDKKLLTPHLLRMMFDEPFFTQVVRGLNVDFSDTLPGGVPLPTAAVYVKDCDPHLTFSPTWFKTLKSQEIKGVLKHECFHLVYDHCTTRLLSPHTIDNIAKDLAINSGIPEDELPKGGCVPGKALAHGGPLSDLIAKLPKHKASEWYFSRIMNDEEAKKDAMQNFGSGMMDLHDLFGNMSEEEKELFKGKMKDILAKAVKACDRTGKWGSVSSDMREKLRELVSSEVDWRAILRQFCGHSKRGTRTTTWSNMNVVHIHEDAGPLAPGTKRGFTSSIACFIDQSGSVSDKDLQLAFGEMTALAKHTEFVTYHFDTSVDEKSLTTWKKRRSMGASRTRCGGTDFQCVTDFMHLPVNRARYDGFVVISDGEAQKPGPSKVKRCYLLIPGTKLLFEKDRNDYVANMKWPKSDG